MRAARKLSVMPVLLAALVTCIALPARAAVEDAVPADAILFVKIREPYAQFKRLRDGELWARLSDPQTMPQLAQAVRNIEAMVEQVELQHGVDVDKVFGDILAGDAAIVGLPGGAEALGTSVFLTEADSAESLGKALAEFLRVERAVGSLEDEYESAYKGVDVHSSVLRGKARHRHHVLLGRVLAVSEDLEPLRKVIDVHKGETTALGALAQYQEARTLAAEGAAVTAYVDLQRVQQFPHRSGEIHRPGRRGRNPLRRLIRATLGEVFPDLRYAVFSAVGDDGGLTGRLTVKLRHDELPPLLESLLPEPGSAMDIVRLAPESTAVVAGRSVNHAAIWDAVVETLEEHSPAAAEEARAKLDALVTVLGGIHTPEQLFEEIGPQMAVFILPSGEAGNPPEVAVALELRETAHIPLALETLVGTAAVAATAEGKAQASIEYDAYKGVPLTSVHVEMPAGWRKLRPTMCVVDGNLVLSTTADAARRIIDASRSGATLPAGDVEGTLFGFMRMNAVQLRAMLDRHAAFLVRHSMQKQGKTQQRARREIGALRVVLSLLEEVELVGTFRPGRTDHTFTVTLSPVQE